jgi:hypothetical protein
MPVYLNELEIGLAQDVVGFLYLLLCMGVVAMTTTMLYGLHIDTRADAQAACQALRQFMTSRGAGPIVALYGCCNRNIRYGKANAFEDWKSEMRMIAGVLNFRGPVRGFDTGIIAPKDGTYVEYQPNYPGRFCRIYYKRNEKM